MQKIPFMMFIEPINLGNALYFVYGYDKEEDNCNCIGIYSNENPDLEVREITFSQCDLSRSYLEDECGSFYELNSSSIDYLKKIFQDKGYDPEFIGDQVESIDDLMDINTAEFEKMAKIRESVQINEDGTLNTDNMTEEEIKKFYDDLYHLIKADAAVFAGASDDGEDLNDLKIDRWNESLKIEDIEVNTTVDEDRRSYLNEGHYSSIRKVHNWKPGDVSKKFDKYTENVIPVDDHTDTLDYIKNMDLGRTSLKEEKIRIPELKSMKESEMEKIEESAPNFRPNDGDFPLIVKFFDDEAKSMPCPECGSNIYDDPDEEGDRTCDECGYTASEEEWEENCVFDSGLADIIEDEISLRFEAALRKFGVDDLKYWFVSMKPGYYQGLQVYVEDSEYSIEDDMYYQRDIEDFLLDDNIKKYGIDVSAFKKYLEDVNFDGYEDYHMSTAFEDFLKEYPVEGIKGIEDIFSLIDEENKGGEAKKINDFLGYLVKDLGWTKIEKVAAFSNGEAIYKKVEKKSKKSNIIKEARLQEGPGAGYEVQFLGIKVDNVKIDEIKIDDYNCQYVEFEADIVPGKYDWTAEGYDWRVDGNSDYLDHYMFYEKASISGGKVKGTCQNGYQGWADANATWTIEEFAKEIKGESYDLGIMYGGGWSHSDITSPFEMEDEYGIDVSDERSGYKNSYIDSASIDLEDPEMLNQIIEDTRYSDDYFEDEEEEEEENLEESKKTKIKEFFGGEWAEPEDDENLDAGIQLDTDDYDDEEDDKEDYEGTVSDDLAELRYLLDKQKAGMALDSYELRVLQSLIRDYPDEYYEYGSYEENYGSDWEDDDEDDEDDTGLTDDDLEDSPWYEHAYQWYESKKLNKSRFSESYRAPKEQMDKAIEAAKGEEIIAAWDPGAWVPGNPCTHEFYYQVVGKDDNGDTLVHRLKSFKVYESSQSAYSGTEHIIFPIVNEFIGEIQPLSSLENVSEFDPENDRTYIHWKEYFD